ncbi:VWA domain-containing protein [Verrucomicrobiaceae bacterium N1E253]|uniref:VWA domain-containing protein n=1 Tax=Oceaniferula marina TaxID=2748318 RepID=A0A851GL68_9BACT|nr:vWA domain-containing protein [Oceaniferula marina]NWK54904.1 VWA domain-containing protein [Oceaniferula marina]
MSLHAQLSPEALKRLHVQQRNSTITSIIISILVVLLIGIILLWILLPPIDNFTPEIVSYQAGNVDDRPVKRPQMQRNVERKPSSPSSSMARVIASSTVSDLAIPVPEEITPVDSMEFGNGDDFGDGWGDGSGWGGGGSTSFFGQEVRGSRILYVIDYSASMGGERQRLMRKELAYSVLRLPPDKQFQMIFFAGPAWVAGDKVQMKGKQSATVVSGGNKFAWSSNGKAHKWDPKGKREKAPWLRATDSQVETSELIIKRNKLVWGTNWENPLKMAFDMEPLPDTIVFMTDGLASGDPVGIAKRTAALAKKNNIVVNTVALMEPKAADAMETLAKGTGGTFVLVNKDGSRSTIKNGRVQKVEPATQPAPKKVEPAKPTPKKKAPAKKKAGNKGKKGDKK